MLAERPHCGRLGDDRYTAACEERGNVGLGVAVTVTALLLAVGVLWWRHLSMKNPASGTAEAPKPRGSTRADREAVLQQLREEYDKKLEERDPDVLEAARDWADNDGSPWRVDVFMSLALLVLFGSVLCLIVFFSAVKALVDK